MLNTAYLQSWVVAKSVEELAELSETIGSVSSRKRKVELLASFLGTLDENEARPTVLILLGRPPPESDAGTLDVGYVTVEKVRKGRQSTLFGEEVMIADMLPLLHRVANESGSGSRKRKENLLRNLFGRLSPKGRELMRRSLYGELRIGASEGVILEAIALSSGQDLERVRKASMFVGDTGILAEKALRRDELDIRPEPFVPIRPMLAETAISVEEAFDRMGGAALEFKLDGVRVQVHRYADEVRIFSRRLTDVTPGLPELVEQGLELPPMEYIMEGEVIAYTDRPLPFQDLMRRFRRIHDLDEVSKMVPVRLYLFDLLMLDGEECTDLPYSERYDLLRENAPKEMLVPRIVTNSLEEGREFFNRSLKEGHEGVMFKDLDAIYAMGKRGSKWLKVKRSHELDLVIVAAEWGHGRRRGWLSDYYLAARDDDGFSIVGKTYKGLTDEEFKSMTERLIELKIEEEDRVVKVLPRIVVGVAFDDIQTSPRYPSGMALRFARIKTIREDKEPAEADDIEEVRRLHDEQFETKGRIDWG
jgi:DNA ligase-1